MISIFDIQNLASDRCICSPWIIIEVVHSSAVHHNGSSFMWWLSYLTSTIHCDHDLQCVPPPLYAIMSSWFATMIRHNCCPMIIFHQDDHHCSLGHGARLEIGQFNHLLFLNEKWFHSGYEGDSISQGKDPCMFAMDVVSCFLRVIFIATIFYVPNVISEGLISHHHRVCENIKVVVNIYLPRLVRSL